MNAVALAPWNDRRDDVELKKLFAKAMLECNFKPYDAARAVFTNPTDGMRAINASDNWPNDPIVKMEQARLIEDLGEESFLPSKVMLAREIYSMGQDTTASIGDRLAAFRLYSDLRQFVPRDKGPQVSLNIQQNRVMVMPDHGSDDDWEKKLVDHQQKAIEHVRD